MRQGRKVTKEVNCAEALDEAERHNQILKNEIKDLLAYIFEGPYMDDLIGKAIECQCRLEKWNVIEKH